jgi:hypothetical protein
MMKSNGKKIPPWWALEPETEEEKAWWLNERRLNQQKLDARAKTTRFVKLTGVARQLCLCGAGKAHMHHPDYDHPLLIAFLCARCHRREHTGLLSTPFEVHDLRWLAVADQVAFA